METWWADTKPPFAHRPSAVTVIGEALVNCQPESSKFECAAGTAPPSFNTATVAAAACETPQTTRSIIATGINGVCHLRGVSITTYCTPPFSSSSAALKISQRSPSLISQHRIPTSCLENPTEP